MSPRPFGRGTPSRRGPIAARGRRALATPALALVASACFATRTDVQLLQSDIAALRTESVQRDSARAAQLDRVISTLGLVSDSLRVTSSRLAQFQGDVRGELFSTGQQLIQIQELTGQSQRRLQELRAGLEDRSSSAVPAAAGAVPPGTVAAAAVGAAAVVSGASATAAPGPNQLYQLSLDQLRRGSAAAARAGFQDLLRQYPTSDLAPDATFYVAESWAATGGTATADSVYEAVAQRYPTSPRAPTALYKHALILLQAGKVPEGRAALQEVVNRYPRSDEAELARERLNSTR